ncbi:MAG: class I SAM-dependent methyltransferase [Actinomycetota bacterium]|nr:class I SAM-dependent methyltransferase [Actinomycetota bacterium]
MSGNLDHWQDLAAFHGTGNDDYYDIPALVSGEASLRATEQGALDRATDGSGVAGLRVAHVQSHIGIDSIHLARLGAQVTAFDFSPLALERLRELAGRCGVDVTTEVADSQQLATDPFARWHGQFDLVYATVGVICWIADLESWMRGAAALLAPGGRLVLVELHPLLCMPETLDPLVIDYPYVNDGVRHYSGTGSYANADADLSWTIDQYAWSLGETVNAAVGAGLEIVRLDEHVSIPFDPRGSLLRREDDGMYRMRLGTGTGDALAEPLPVLFTLIAQSRRAQQVP